LKQFQKADVKQMGEACLLTDYTAAIVKTMASSSEYGHCPWYALKVRTGSERMVATVLRSRGFAPYCPTQKVRRRYSDRMKMIDAPMFPGYVFCQFDVHKKLPVISTPGVDYIVGFSNGPIAIPEQELVNVRRLIDSGASPIRSLVCGERVRVTSGILEGVEGSLIRDQKGDQLVVSIPLLNQSACLHIEEFAVCPIV
jgi:transcription termination/antitermination protein NusG